MWSNVLIGHDTKKHGGYRIGHVERFYAKCVPLYYLIAATDGLLKSNKSIYASSTLVWAYFLHCTYPVVALPSDAMVRRANAVD